MTTKGIFFFSLLLSGMLVKAAENQNRDLIRDQIVSIVKSIMHQSRSWDCSFEICENAQLVYPRAQTGYALVLKEGLPVRIVTPRGMAALVDLQNGIFTDVDASGRFFDTFALEFCHEHEGLALLENEKLYRVKKCNDLTVPSFSMK